MNDLETCIQRHWIHSHEEDTPEVRVYRTADFSFPPSRGRVGMEFQEGGELLYDGIAATDGTDQASGHWANEGAGRIRVEVNNDRIQPFTLEVVSCNEDVLKVRR